MWKENNICFLWNFYKAFEQIAISTKFLSLGVVKKKKNGQFTSRSGLLYRPVGHFLFYFGLSFFEFHLTHLNIKRQKFWSGVQKSVHRPLMSPYLTFK